MDTALIKGKAFSLDDIADVLAAFLSFYKKSLACGLTFHDKESHDGTTAPVGYIVDYLKSCGVNADFCDKAVEMVSNERPDLAMFANPVTLTCINEAMRVVQNNGRFDDFWVCVDNALSVKVPIMRHKAVNKADLLNRLSVAPYIIKPDPLMRDWFDTAPPEHKRALGGEFLAAAGISAKVATIKAEHTLRSEISSDTLTTGANMTTDYYIETEAESGVKTCMKVFMPVEIEASDTYTNTLKKALLEIAHLASTSGEIGKSPKKNRLLGGFENVRFTALVLYTGDKMEREALEAFDGGYWCDFSMKAGRNNYSFADNFEIVAINLRMVAGMLKKGAKFEDARFAAATELALSAGLCESRFTHDVLMQDDEFRKWHDTIGEVQGVGNEGSTAVIRREIEKRMDYVEQLETEVVQANKRAEQERQAKEQERQAKEQERRAKEQERRAKELAIQEKEQLLVQLRKAGITPAVS